jgi:hypothetical protein
MFTKKITDSDAFIEMSSAAQALYFHLNQSADDDGFNNQIQMAMFRSHASVDDLKVLMMKNFIIRFESGVIVIKHWRMHNTLRKDRYNPTNFKEELALLNIKDNGSYSLNIIDGCQAVANPVPQVSIGKYSIDKDSIEENIPDDKPSLPTPKHKYGEYNHVLLKDNELEKLKHDFGETETDEAIIFLDEYIEMKGYKAKNHNLVLRKWVFNAVRERKGKGVQNVGYRKPGTNDGVRTSTTGTQQKSFTELAIEAGIE